LKTSRFNQTFCLAPYW